MIREVFQMHVAQRPMCSPGTEIACHRSGSGTADPGWHMSSCLQVLRLAESGAADAAWARGRPARGRLRKAALSPRRRQQTRLRGCSTACSATRGLPAVLARAGPPKAREGCSQPAGTAPGRLCGPAPPPPAGRLHRFQSKRSVLAPSICN